MKVIATNGCYTNNGTQNFTTSRLNRTEAVTVVEKTGDSKTGPMSATHSAQLSSPTSCEFYQETIDY